MTLLGFTVAGTAPEFRRLPFEPPPVRIASVGGTLIDGRATRAQDGLSNWLEPHYEAGMTANHSRLIAVFGAILAAAALRLAPHPPNFTPVGAMALFGGAYLGRKPLAFVAPLAALLLSDAVLGFDRSMAFVYPSMALVVIIGWSLSSKRSVLRIGSAAIVSSVAFFVITNFGMWLFSGFYPRTMVGLEACFVAAIPFFQNTVAGDLFYATLLFGGFRVAELLVPQLRAGKQQPA